MDPSAFDLLAEATAVTDEKGAQRFLESHGAALRAALQGEGNELSAHPVAYLRDHQQSLAWLYQAMPIRTKRASWARHSTSWPRCTLGCVPSPSGFRSRRRTFRRSCGRNRPALGGSERGMAEFGLSPAVLVGATCGLQLLFDRFDYDDSDAYRALRRDEHVFDSAEQGVRLTFEAHRHAFVPTTMLLAQMSTTPGLPADAREPMLSWVVAACEDTPQFIRAISWTWILCEPPSSSSARNAMSGPWS